MKNNILFSAESFAYEYHKNVYAGHGFDHVLSVKNIAQKISEQEGGDNMIISLAALLHDIDDKKLKLSDGKASHRWLLNNAPEYAKVVNDIIQSVSWAKGEIPKTLEGKIVQDSDRLTAIGALGIVRAIQYGESHRAPFSSLGNRNIATTLDHFHKKLLKIIDYLNTDTAKKMAEERHNRIKIFLRWYEEETEVNTKSAIISPI